RFSRSRFWKLTKCEIAKFALIALSPCSPKRNLPTPPLKFGDHANPRRGAKLFLSVFGTLNSITPGTDAMLLSAWAAASRGKVEYSYRRPRFSVRFGLTFQSSCPNTNH